MHDIFSSIKIPRGQISIDDLSRDTMLYTATELTELQKRYDDPDIKKSLNKYRLLSAGLLNMKLSDVRNHHKSNRSS